MGLLEETTILLVEDDPGHARLIEKNLRRNAIQNRIVKLENGQLALEFLENMSGSLTSVVMLLDLNLPVMDGYRVLEKVRQHDLLKHIPVIIITTTDDRREVDKCYELGCNAYVTKPVDYTLFSETLRKMSAFLTVIEVPNFPIVEEG